MLDDLLKQAFNTAYFDPEGGPALSHYHVPGASRLAVIVGDNASGKSFFRRLIEALCSRSKVEAITLSMERRATGGFVSAAIYGDESNNSTGQLSVQTVLTGIKTCQARTSPHIIFWDEPDIGLSDSWAAGVGQTIGAFSQNLPEHTRAVFVATHSRALVRELLPRQPHYIHFGDHAPESLEAWLDSPVVPKDITMLDDLSRRRFKKILRILQSKA